MAEAYKKLGQGTLAGSAGLLYSPAADTEAVIKSINISNNTGTARTVTLYHTDHGATASDADLILPGVEIEAGGFAEWEGTLCMAATEDIQGFASQAGVISYTIWGVEIT